MNTKNLKRIIREEITKIINESNFNTTDFTTSPEERELYKLKNKFLPDFKEYVSLYDICANEGTSTDSYFNNKKYSKFTKKFANDLKKILFALEHGEF